MPALVQHFGIVVQNKFYHNKYCSKDIWDLDRKTQSNRRQAGLNATQVSLFYIFILSTTLNRSHTTILSEEYSVVKDSQRYFSAEWNHHTMLLVQVSQSSRNRTCAAIICTVSGQKYFIKFWILIDLRAFLVCKKLSYLASFMQFKRYKVQEFLSKVDFQGYNGSTLA